MASSTYFNGIVRHKDGVFGTLPLNDFSSSASWLSKTSSLLKFHDDGDSWRIIEFSGAKGRWSDGQMIPMSYFAQQNLFLGGRFFRISFFVEESRMW